VVFVGTFRAGKQSVGAGDGRLHIRQEGAATKFVKQVEHRTFSGREALRRGQRVLYVTERAVFRLVPGGLELIEIAPGVDLQRDILAQMDFVPAISPSMQTMDARLFMEQPMGLREQLLGIPLAQRLELDLERSLLYIDFSGLRVQSAQTIAEIESAVRRCLSPVGARVAVVVNYDHFSIEAELIDHYTAMVQRLERRLLWQSDSVWHRGLPEGQTRSHWPPLNSGWHGGLASIRTAVCLSVCIDTRSFTCNPKHRPNPPKVRLATGVGCAAWQSLARWAWCCRANGEVPVPPCAGTRRSGCTGAVR
jgi:hypothetical protein